MIKGALLVISGPSGAGKSSLIKKILEETPNSCFSISTTTRPMREGESPGVNYVYTDKESFERDIENSMFLEWAKVHDNYYGTSFKQIVKYLQEGKLVVLDIDVQGYHIAKDKFGKLITSVFVTTSSQALLKERLLYRGTDSAEVIERRLNNAGSEMTYIRDYDFLVMNDDFETALEQLLAIAQVARDKASIIDLEEFISNWLDLEK